MDDVDDKIWKLLEEITGQNREDLSDNEDLRMDLELDSLDFASIETDETLGIEIGVDDLVGVNTVGQLRTKLRKMVEEQA